MTIAGKKGVLIALGASAAPNVGSLMTPAAAASAAHLLSHGICKIASAGHISG